MDKRYIIRKAAGEHYLLRLSEEKYYQPLILNESAYEIFKDYEKGLDTDEISAHLAELYEVDKSVVKGDVEIMTARIRSYIGD